jgi:hypothetical protein
MSGGAIGRMTGKINTMRNTINRRLALLSFAAPRAFDNKAGWKLDADGKLEVGADGNPIYINSTGQEQTVKGETISTLNAEARQHRTAKEAAETELAKYKGPDGKPIDPQKALKALDTVGKLDDKTLIDNGEAERLREQVKAQYEAQLTEAKQTNEKLKGENVSLKIDKIFDSSDLVRDGLAVPPDMFRAVFAKNFKADENGNIVAHDASGNVLLSKKNMGIPADHAEALELLVDAYPQKDVILKAPAAGGSGNGGGGGNRGGGRVMKRTDFEALPPHQQAEMAGKVASGEMQIAD